MEIPFGKVAIYLLTFLGYIYSGYGSGLLSNLREAVIAAESVFGNVLENVVAVAQKFRVMHDVFDAAVDEHCVFECPNNVSPVANRNHVPKSNGCGSLGLTIPNEFLPVGEMTKCCNDHDICYDTCNKDKELCDMEFKRCLYRYCNGYEKTSVAGVNLMNGCKGAAKMLFTGTLTLGCKSYKDAQKEACYCPVKNKKKKYTRGDEL